MAGAWVTASLLDHRTAKRLTIAAAALAFWLLGTASSVRAGCGDYLVGVEQTGKHSIASMAPDHFSDRVPICKSCRHPISPPVPVMTVERLPVEQAVQDFASSLILDLAGWDRTDAEVRPHVLPRTPDRPPKI